MPDGTHWTRRPDDAFARESKGSRRTWGTNNALAIGTLWPWRSDDTFPRWSHWTGRSGEARCLIEDHLFRGAEPHLEFGPRRTQFRDRGVGAQLHLSLDAGGEVPELVCEGVEFGVKPCAAGH
ncbi:MAG TPA: hypothetical protein VEW06_06510 [Xanthobacteraceae bacterium]|nr:hypothetical protein [Xanthobacteraceae bacterium]